MPAPFNPSKVVSNQFATGYWILKLKLIRPKPFSYAGIDCNIRGTAYWIFFWIIFASAVGQTKVGMLLLSGHQKWWMEAITGNLKNDRHKSVNGKSTSTKKGGFMLDLQFTSI